MNSKYCHFLFFFTGRHRVTWKQEEEEEEEEEEGP
jgi:Ca2+/H+ antiporter